MHLVFYGATLYHEKEVKTSGWGYHLQYLNLCSIEVHIILIYNISVPLISWEEAVEAVINRDDKVLKQFLIRNDVDKEGVHKNTTG